MRCGEESIPSELSSWPPFSKVVLNNVLNISTNYQYHNVGTPSDFVPCVMMINPTTPLS